MRQLDKPSLKEFAPDIIFSDYPETGGYDLRKLEGLKPFINLSEFTEPKILPKYETDVVYLGNVTDMDSSLLDLYSSGFRVRYYYGKTEGRPCYAGSVPMSECWNVYKNSKVSPVPIKDLGYRELDIIMADGNPLKYTNKKQFLRDVADGVGGKRFNQSRSKAEILFQHTNFDRVSAIMAEMGHNDISKEIKERKKCLV